MSSSYHAALLALVIVALAANAYRRHRGGRPATEHTVDAMYLFAMHALAAANAADKALAAYREVLAEVKADHAPLYVEGACSR